MRELFVVLLLSAVLTSCGGGGATPTNPVTTSYPSTALIQANMAMNYNVAQTPLANAAQNCSIANSGGGAALVCITAAKEGATQTFINAALAYILSVKNTMPIDKAAITTLFNSYQTQDIAWLTSNSFGTASAGATLGITYYPFINAAYAAAANQLAVM